MLSLKGLVGYQCPQLRSSFLFFLARFHWPTPAILGDVWGTFSLPVPQKCLRDLSVWGLCLPWYLVLTQPVSVLGWCALPITHLQRDRHSSLSRFCSEQLGLRTFPVCKAGDALWLPFCKGPLSSRKKVYPRVSRKTLSCIAG